MNFGKERVDYDTESLGTAQSVPLASCRVLYGVLAIVGT